MRKKISIFLNFSLVLLLFSPFVGAEKKKGETKETKEISFQKKTIGQLEAEEKKALYDKITRAGKLSTTINLQEALSLILEVELNFEELPHVYNIKGGIYTKLGDYDLAFQCYNRANKLANIFHHIHGIPKSERLIKQLDFQTRFNMAELHFVQKKFSEAKKRFQKIIVDFPLFKASVKRLVQFKIFVCDLKLGNEKNVEEQLKLFSPMDSTPIYYYANAAWCYHNDDRQKAGGWLKSAANIYKENKNMIYSFLDTFIEMGWLNKL